MRTFSEQLNIENFQSIPILSFFLNMERIHPKYQTLYDYDFDQTQDQIMILLPVPIGFDTKTISIKFANSPDNQQLGLRISIPNSEIPLVCGTLFAEVITESMETSLDTTHPKGKYDSFYVIKINKMSNNEWPTLILRRHPITNEIDPKSSYLMYVITGLSDKPEDKRFAEEELAYAVTLGFPLAVRVYADLLFEKGERDQAIQLLRTMADEYVDLDAMCKIGRVLAWQTETRKEGLKYLKKASNLGQHDVDGLIGRILSPTSGIEYDAKNAKEAIRYLESAIRANPGDEAETEKDNAELGKILAFEFKGEKTGDESYTSTIISLAAVGISLAAVAALFYHFKRRH